ncbi:hypothetical protein [Bacillus sp. FSL K6-2839]
MYTEVTGFNKVITFTKDSLDKNQTVKITPLGNDCYRIEMSSQGKYQ